MIYFFILIMSILATSIIAHFRIRSYLIASIAAMFLGPLIVCLGFYIITGFDDIVGEYLPDAIIVLTIIFSPVPFVLGLCVRFGRRCYRESHNSCIQCGQLMNIDIAQGCKHCGWKQKWIRKGQCPQCSYDLRAEFSKGCPECGWRRGIETQKV